MPFVHRARSFSVQRLERCTNGTGYLRDYTMEQLEQLDASAYFSHETAGERIPRLTDVLQLARSLGLGINVEVKHLDRARERDGGRARARGLRRRRALWHGTIRGRLFVPTAALPLRSFFAASRTTVVRFWLRIFPQTGRTL